MVWSNYLLAVLLVAVIASLSCYFKEKRVLREFMQQSRRHRNNKEIDVKIKSRAKRYLNIAALFFVISIPFAVEVFVEAFVEENWKAILCVLILPIAFFTIRSFDAATKVSNQPSIGFRRSNSKVA